MSISKLKKLIYKIENVLKNDERFNPDFRRRMKFIYYENNKETNPVMLNSNNDGSIDLSKLDELKKQSEDNLAAIKSILE